MDDFLRAIDELLTSAGYQVCSSDTVPGAMNIEEAQYVIDEHMQRVMREMAREITDSFFDRPFEGYRTIRERENRRVYLRYGRNED